MNDYKQILPYVKRPSRYLGNEVNSIHKDLNAVRTRFALVFPDLYEIGMSHLGLRILYHLLNKRPDVAAERFFVPETDYEQLLQKKGLDLSSQESNLPLNRFHIVGFSVEYELSFVNVLHVLRLGSIPLRTKERDKDWPLIIAGGSSVSNPEPLADFIDAFVLGDGEEAAVEIVDVYQEWREGNGTKDELLCELSRKEGIYVPSLFEITYHDKEIERIVPQREGYTKVNKRVIKALDSAEYPVAPIVPYTKIVHDRVSIEVARGCFRSCKFCQASRVQCPYRERNIENVFRLVEENLKNTGYEEISLTSLNICDYRNLLLIVRHLMNSLATKNIALSLPSIMVGFLDSEIIKDIQRVRKTGFTLVPEAGTERLRRVIRKDVTEERIVKDIEKIIGAGWNSFKLYFMIGLPTETEEDLKGIIRLCHEILRTIKKKKARVKNINVSIASFVPKPHTPFQWFPQHETGLLKEKLGYLRKGLRDRRFSFKDHAVEMSFLEAVFSRGDRRLGEVLVKALDKGCKLDAWTEHFQYQKWIEALTESGIDPAFYANRTIGLDRVLPWDHLDVGISKEHLKKGYLESISCPEEPLPIEKKRDEEQEKNQERIKETFFSQQPAAKDRSEISLQKIRLTYRKMKDMRFLSHLELISVFNRALRRADIPLSYTRGFHPRPKLSFGMALPIGVESYSELLDVELSLCMEPEEFASRMNRELPDGLKIVFAENIPLKSQSISLITERVVYRIFMKVNAPEDKKSAVGCFQRMIDSFLSNNEIVIERKKEREVKRIDIRPLITGLKAVNARQDMMKLELVLKMRESDNVKPEETVLELIRSEKIDGEIVSIRKIKADLREEKNRP